MNHSDFPILYFKDIVVKEISNRSFFFYFKIDECNYLLQVESSVPKSIQHMPHGKGVCAYCGSGHFFVECDVLKEYKDEIYHQLKNHPSIRLRLMF